MNEINKNCEKKKYKKKNEFKFNIIFNNNGETLEKIVERAFRKLLFKKKLEIILRKCIFSNSNRRDNMI